MKIETFPYLKIAKDFGLDYGDVLNAVQWLRVGGIQSDATRAVRAVPTLWKKIVETNDQFKEIQAGMIDWQSGKFKTGCPHCGYYHPYDGMCLS